VAERWDGSNWTLQATSNVPGGSGGLFIGAACPGASACIAVGYGFDASGTFVTLGQGWDGTQWSVQPTGNPEGSRGAHLNGVACKSPSSCMSVGQSTGGTLAERWDGTTWSIQPTPTSASPGASLNAVSCTSPNPCTAVGNTASALLAERWDGTTWTVQSTPTPPGTQGQGDFFGGVWCSSPSACTAVGVIFTPAPLTVAERWDGSSWSVQDTPNLPGATDVGLPAVSCPTLSICTAVGGYANDGPMVTLAEQWNRNGGSAPVAASSAPTAGSSVRSCALPLATAAIVADRMVSSQWVRSRPVHARPVSSGTVRPPNLDSRCGT
jgi:hypothetical protein